MIEVKDRIPTYPGRIQLTPVDSQANTFDMVRADSPTEAGTPINKALFDSISDDLAHITPLEDKVDDIAGYLGYPNDEDVVGLEADFVNNVYTRIAGAVGKSAGADFDAFPMYGGRRRCNVTDGGVVVAYYDTGAGFEYSESGYLTKTVTVDGMAYPAGTAVQVMVEQPKFYYRIVPLTLEPISGGVGYHVRKARYYVSSTPRKGFKIHPAFVVDGVELEKIYLSAYEGCLMRVNYPDAGLTTYVLDDAQIMSTSVDRLSSIAGAKPISGSSQQLTRANARALAHNRGSGWELQTIAALSCSQLLMVIEYASFNVQDAIGRGANGLPYSASANNAINTGGTSSLGDASGSASGTLNQVSVTYRGEENLWGNLYTYVDGVNPQVEAGSACTLYVADHDFSDSTSSGAYAKVGFTPAGSSNYISAFGYSEDCDWLFMPTETQGNSSLPVGDNFYLAASAAGWKALSIGGKWDDNTLAGSYYWYATTTGGHSNAMGARLCYFPQS